MWLSMDVTAIIALHGVILVVVDEVGDALVRTRLDNRIRTVLDFMNTISNTLQNPVASFFRLNHGFLIKVQDAKGAAAIASSDGVGIGGACNDGAASNVHIGAVAVVAAADASTAVATREDEISYEIQHRTVIVPSSKILDKRKVIGFMVFSPIIEVIIATCGGDMSTRDVDGSAVAIVSSTDASAFLSGRGNDYAAGDIGGSAVAAAATTWTAATTDASTFLGACLNQAVGDVDDGSVTFVVTMPPLMVMVPTWLLSVPEPIPAPRPG